MTFTPEQWKEFIEADKRYWDSFAESLASLRKSPEGYTLCEFIGECNEVATVIGMGDTFWCAAHNPLRETNDQSS